MPAVRIPDGLTLKITTNAREQTTRIVAYRKGGFKRAYKAIIPMCADASCKSKGSPHTLVWHRRMEKKITTYHPRDVDNLVKKLIKSYS